MEFRILGPLEVVEGGRPVSIRRGKDQALLAYLLLHANEVIPSGTLIDALWDERPPPTAPKILQNAVSHLRKQLGDGRLTTKGPGYVLRVEDDELDLHRFERLAGEGRSKEALGLWRGTPLLDVREERFADEARRRLDEQRLGLIEQQFEHDLEAGRAAEVIPELEALVGSHPLRERLYALLMRALYHSGRQADALETYQRARRYLADELGLEPGPELQELERKILAHDADLAGPRPKRIAGKKARASRRRLLILLGGSLLAAAAVFAALALLGDNSKPLVASHNSLAVVDLADERVTDVVPLGTVPRGIGFSPAGVWIANPRSGTVTWIDPETHRIIDTIGLGAGAIEIATGGGGVWIVTGNDDTLVHLDARTGGQQGTLALPAGAGDVSASAWGVAFGNDAVWASSGGLVLKVEPESGSVVFRNACCPQPFDIAFGFDAVWVANFGTHLGVVSARTGKTTELVDVGLYTDSVVTGYGFVWLTVTDNHGQHAALLKIDPQTRRTLQTIPLDAPDLGRGVPLQLAAAEGSIWVADGETGEVLKIDPSGGTITKRIHVGGKPWGMAFGAGRLWVTVD